MSIQSNKIPTFLKRKSQKFSKAMFQIGSPRGEKRINECSSFRYLSPKSKDNTCSENFDFASAIKSTNEGRVILLSEENQKLKSQIIKLTKQKTQVQEENIFLRNAVKNYCQQLNSLKLSAFISPTCHSRTVQKQQLSTTEFSCFNGDGMSIMNDQKFERAETSVYFDQASAQLLESSRALTVQNQILQENLNNANESMSKMKKQLESAQINLRVMQRKLMGKQKELKIEKAKHREIIDKKNIFDLSDDE